MKASIKNLSKMPHESSWNGIFNPDRVLAKFTP